MRVVRFFLAVGSRLAAAGHSQPATNPAAIPPSNARTARTQTPTPAPHHISCLFSSFPALCKGLRRSAVRLLAPHLGACEYRTYAAAPRGGDGPLSVLRVVLPRRSAPFSCALC